MKAIFIDRDGVVNKDPGGWTEYSYVTRWSDFHFIPGSIGALKLLTRNGFKIIIISNQAGVSKGHFSKKDLDSVTSGMCGELGKNGVRIEDIYYCIHKDEDKCNCRKPRTGLLDIAAKKYKINFNETYFIGDSLVDVKAGRHAGCKTIFVLSGKTSEEDMKKWDERPDYIFRNLLEAVKWLVEKGKRREMRAAKRRSEIRKDKGETREDKGEIREDRGEIRE